MAQKHKIWKIKTGLDKVWQNMYDYGRIDKKNVFVWENMENEVRQKEIKEVMDITELADYLGIGKSKIYSMIRNKKIPASRIGRQYRFSKQVVDAWLKEKIITKKDDIHPALFEKEKNEDNNM